MLDAESRRSVRVGLNDLRLETAAMLAVSTAISLIAAAHGVVEVANASMLRALRLVSVQRGYDVTRYALNCFGGAGGQHACLLHDAAEDRHLQLGAQSGVAGGLLPHLHTLAGGFERGRIAPGGGYDRHARVPVDEQAGPAEALDLVQVGHRGADHIDGAIDPVGAYRAAGYRAKVAAERPAVAGGSGGIV